ncbi:MAG: hypothetical protein V4436_00190, partial [Patescibacteria group bacterium]
MSQEKNLISISGEQLLSARKAAARLSCAPDYVGKLCREGKLEGIRQNNAWFVPESAIVKFEAARTEARTQRAQELSQLRKQESEAFKKEKNAPIKTEAPSEITNTFKEILASRRVLVAVAIVLLFAAVTYAGASASNAKNILSQGDASGLSASLAQVQSPFFGNSTSFTTEKTLAASGKNIFSILASLFAPKKVATTPTTPVTTSQQPSSSNTVASAPVATSTKSTTIVHNTYPVTERTEVRTVSGITEAEVDAKLSALDNGLRSLLFSTINSLPGSLPSSGGITNNVALSQRIDHLDGITLNSVVVHNLSGLTDNDIPDNITINTSSLTSTATSTLAGITLSGLDCTIYNNSGKLTTDASGNIVCADDYGASGAGTPGGANGTVQYNDAGGFGGSAGFAFNKVSGVLTVPQLLVTSSTTLQNVTASSATTTNLFATNATITNIVLGSLTGPLQAVNGAVSATSTLSVVYGGTGISSVPTYGQVLVGNSAGSYTLTSTSSLGIASAVWGNITGTLSNQSDLQNELNLKLSSSTLTLFDKGLFFSTTSTSYFLSQNQGAAFSTTSANAFINASSSIPHIPGVALGDILYWTGSAWGVRATSTLGLGGSGGGSVTSVDASGGTTGLSFTGGPVTSSGTLTLSGTLAVANGGTGSTTLSGLLKGNGTSGVQSATAGVDYVASNSGDWTGTFDGQEGAYYLANSFSTSSANYFLSLNQGNAFSTTSTNYWKSVNDFFSTTSANYLLSTIDKGYFFSTTSADYYISQANVSGFSTTSANYFSHSSTTIAKTYTANTFTGSQTFTGGLSTNALTLGSLNGPLSANNGVVSATTSVGVVYGGTGLTSLPTFGQLLLGQANGTYALTSTSSLGFISDVFRDWRMQNGYLMPTTSVGIIVNASSTIGGGTQTTGLTILGGATSTGNLAVQGTGTSSVAGTTYLNGLLTVNGNIVPTASNTYGLGQPGLTFKDIYIGPNSLYVNGQKVLSTDGGNDVIVSADIDQNLKFKTTGVGNIEINPSGTGQVLLKSSINVTAGKSITTSDLSALPIPNGATLGSVTISGHTITASDTNGSVFLTPNGSGGTYVTTGNFGIGSTTPATTLAVNGNGYLTGGLGVGTVNTSAGTLITTGNATVGGTLKISTVTSCTGSSALQTDGSGNVSCGSITVSGSSAAGGWATNNTGRVTLATTTDLVAVGATTTLYAKLAVLSGATATTTFALVPASSQTANIIDIYNTSGQLSSVLTAGGNFGLGTTSPSQTLSVQGGALISGNLTVAGITATGTIAGANLTTTGSSTIAGQFNAVGGATFGNVSIGSLSGLLYGTNGSVGTIATSTLGLLGSTSITASAPLSWNSSTGALTISQSGTGANGYLSSTDFNTFNNKISSTSLSGSTGISYNSGTGVVTNTGVTSLVAGSGIAVSGATGAVTITNTIGYPFPSNATSTLLTFSGGILSTASSTINGLSTINSTSTNATTTNFAISGVSSALLKTLSSGAVVAATAGSDYLTSAFVFAYPFIGNATSTTLTFSGGLVSVGSTTINGNATTTGNSYIGGTATIGTLNGLLYGTNGMVGTIATNTLGLLSSSSISATAPLQYAASTGIFSITQSTTGGNGYLSSVDFNTFNNKISSTSLSAGNGIAYNSTTGVITNTIGYEFPSNATTTQIAFNGGLTATNAIFTNSTSTNATTTTFAISGVTSSLLKTLSTGAVVAAVAGTDYVTNANLFAWPFTPTNNFGVNTSATSTPIFAQSGLFASSTSRFSEIVTISATTTNLLSTGSTTIAGQFNAVGGATFGNFIGINATTTNATSTNFAITGLTANAGQCLSVTPAGTVVTQSCQSGAGSAAFSFLTNYGVLTAATSSVLWAQNGIFASSTSQFAGINTISATTTLLSVTSSTTIAGQLNAVGGATLGSLTAGASNLSSLTLGSALTAGNGGTGISNPSAAGILLGSYAGGSWQQLSTSSLAINFADLVGIATDAQVSNSLTITGGSIDNVGIGLTTPSSAIFTTSSSTNATSSTLYINSTIAGAGLTSCSSAADKLLWNASTLQFACGNDQSGSGGGSDGNFTFFNGSGIRLATSSNQVLIGNATHTATSTLSKLEVWGGATIDTLTATEATTTSLYASGQSVFGGRVGIGSTSPSVTLAIAGGSVLQVIAASSTLATSTPTANSSTASYVSGNFAYVADYAGGLKIYDVTNPKVPALLGSYTGITTANDVVVSGRYAYVADVSTGLVIIDVSRPNAPTLVGTYSVTGTAKSVALSGKYAYVTDSSGHALRIVDVSNPASPTLAGSYNTGGNPNSVAVAGKYAYILDEAIALY